MPGVPPKSLLAGVLLAALILRGIGLDWGIPGYDAQTLRAAPQMRHSFHFDEDDFLRSLLPLRPAERNFYVSNFHWGTLQFYLIEGALLAAQAGGFVASPWREDFLGNDAARMGRVFVAGRWVSALLGAATCLLGLRIGRRLWNERAGLISALILALLPFHVVQSHFLTSDVTMIFFLLLALDGSLAGLDARRPYAHLAAGLGFGLATAAKYHAVFLAPAAIAALGLAPAPRRRSVLLWGLGAGGGFLLGTPYMFSHWPEFREAIQKSLLSTLHYPPGAVPDWPELIGLQAWHGALYGLGLPLALLLPWSLLRAPGGPTRRQLSVLGLALLGFLVAPIVIRQPMLRYLLPALCIASLPLGAELARWTERPRGTAAAAGLLLATGLWTGLQVKILASEHTASQAWRWIMEHVPPGSTLEKGWPELPGLDPARYRVINFYTRPKLADFHEFFQLEDGSSVAPDYVLLDDLPTFEIPAWFQTQLDQRYARIATFAAPPSIGGWSLPEPGTPHDWRISHPRLQLYQRRHPQD